MMRTLEDFLGKELLFEHLQSLHEHFLDERGYERTEMVEKLSAHLRSAKGCKALTDGLAEEEIDLLFVLRQVGGIAPRRWLFREMASRGSRSAEEWRPVLMSLRRRHILHMIGSRTVYLPEGMAEALGDSIRGIPDPVDGDILPGASALRQSVHGLVLALLNHLHGNPPRVMAEEDRIWKRDLEGMAEFFHTYLQEPGANGDHDSMRLIRGRLGRMVELFRKMGFLERRGKRLHVDPHAWTRWAEMREVDRQSLLLSFLRENYENLTVALEALVSWKDTGWVSVDSLTEAVRYRALRGSFHVLRIRPHSRATAEGPGHRWVAASMFLLADLGFIHTGTDSAGVRVARPTASAVVAWSMLRGNGRRRPRKKNASAGPRAYAQPNFELLIPEECEPTIHRKIGSIAELRTLDRFWTYALTRESVCRGVEEGMTAGETFAILEETVENDPPANVVDAVRRWASVLWWETGDGDDIYLRGEEDALRRVSAREDLEGIVESTEGGLLLTTSIEEATRWLEEHGLPFSPGDRDGRVPPGVSARDRFNRATEAWKRRLSQRGEAPPGTFWEKVVPVEPLPVRGRDSRRASA
ncbi:MAG: hypothetical protein QF819_10750 [Gemmatimonadota bacterium]|nr:hypothetical protein [Gemmatimonadota bacterium]MDP6803628.1 hypothetical protein [Gemmatimonadota bacterium]MDP7032262.1 hypothetical protein [Gemmatimonadota bacterium]